MLADLHNRVVIQYNDAEGVFDISYPFCRLRFHMPMYIRAGGATEIEMVNCDVFEYISGGSKEYESISRRILGESDNSPIPYSIMDGGYRLQQYNVDVITELPPDEVVRKICTVCERSDAKWELQKVSS